MYQIGLVAVGGAVGASGRHLLNLAAARLIGPGFPAGTLFVNVLGSLLMGVLAGWLASRSAGEGDSLRLFLGTGILGGFTTFSAFSLDAVLLWERGETGLALSYVAGSVALSIAALLVGMTVARSVA